MTPPVLTVGGSRISGLAGAKGDSSLVCPLKPKCVPQILDTTRHVLGSQQWICDLGGSRGKMKPWIHDPSGSLDESEGRIYDPIGSLDKTKGRIHDPSGSSDKSSF